MLISGLQKLTLLDYPGLVACTVFTPGCNLRCPFCHNASLALPERERDSLAEAEVLGFLKKRAGVLDGVAVTGGEPLLQPDLDGFLGRLKDMGYKVKLDTNGTLPQALRRVVEAGLADRVAMDLKTCPERYPAVVGRPEIDITPIRESVAFLMGSGVEYEFRTTAVKGLHRLSDFRGIGEWIRGAREYFLQSFRDSGDLISPEGLSEFSKEEMEQMAETVRPYVPSVKIRGI